MGHTRINRDHKIKAVHQCCRLGVVCEMFGHINNMSMFAQQFPVASFEILLQAHELRVEVENAGQNLKRQ